MNIKLLRKIQKRILEEPAQFQMDSWFLNNPNMIPNCGTAACIGGWAVTLGKRRKRPSTIACKLASCAPHETFRVHHENAVLMNSEINKYLRLDDEQRKRLTDFSYWPEKYRKLKSEGSSEYAKQAAERIDHFIKTNGEE
jgi:hypothetical protein